MRAATGAVTVAVAASLGALAGCTPGGSDDADDEPPDTAPVPSVTVPPERLTPFCQAMIDLSDRLATDPPEDETALILETYVEIEDEAPDLIAEDFATVIELLRAGVADTVPDEDPVTTDPPITTGVTGPTIADSLPDEGYLPPDEPAQRVNEYVDLVCRDSDNNPGPPPTEPQVELPETTAP